MIKETVDSIRKTEEKAQRMVEEAADEAARRKEKARAEVKAFQEDAVAQAKIQKEAAMAQAKSRGDEILQNAWKQAAREADALRADAAKKEADAIDLVIRELI